MLRAAAPTLPVIAMSGGGQSGDLELLNDAKLLGAVALLAKPFSNTELLAAHPDRHSAGFGPAYRGLRLHLMPMPDPARGPDKAADPEQ